MESLVGAHQPRHDGDALIKPGRQTLEALIVQECVLRKTILHSLKTVRSHAALRNRHHSGGCGDCSPSLIGYVTAGALRTAGMLNISETIGTEERIGLV